MLIRGKFEPCAEDRMAENTVRLRTLAPFGGITRIRFKGSAPKPFGALSAMAAPPHFETTYSDQ